jgi:hypothetical protein
MGKPLHFKGSAFHRVIPQFMCACAMRLLDSAPRVLLRISARLQR